MKHDRSVVLIHHDSTEIWESTCGLTLVIGTLKNMASTGVLGVLFVLLNAFLAAFHTHQECF